MRLADVVFMKENGGIVTGKYPKAANISPGQKLRYSIVNKDSFITEEEGVGTVVEVKDDGND